MYIPLTTRASLDTCPTWFWGDESLFQEWLPFYSEGCDSLKTHYSKLDRVGEKRIPRQQLLEKKPDCSLQVQRGGCLGVHEHYMAHLFLEGENGGQTTGKDPYRTFAPSFCSDFMTQPQIWKLTSMYQIHSPQNYIKSWVHLCLNNSKNYNDSEYHCRKT